MGLSTRMAKPGRRSVLGTLAGLLVAAVLFLPSLAHAQGAVRSVHGDWQIRCDTPPGAQAEQCALIQLSLIHI